MEKKKKKKMTKINSYTPEKLDEMIKKHSNKNHSQSTYLKHMLERKKEMDK